MSSDRLVAFGGGRVIDTAKAIAAVTGARVAAIPTTLSGAEMTRIHKLPDGHKAERGSNRPVLVIADPDVDDRPARARAPRVGDERARARRRLPLHAVRAARLAAWRRSKASRLIAAGIEARTDARPGARLARSRATRSTARCFSLHHVICQSLVRVLRIPHAETNAAILPRVIEALLPRAPRGDGRAGRCARHRRRTRCAARIEELSGGRTDARRDRRRTAKSSTRPSTRSRRVASSRMTPDTPDRDELRRIIESAW